MFQLTLWPSIGVGLVLLIGAVLLAVWWRQQTFRWWVVVAAALVAAPALSWWSGQVFVVADYRAGCDSLCPGYRGAPFPIYEGQTAGGDFLPAGFLLNTLLQIGLLLSWAALIRAVVHRLGSKSRSAWLVQGLVGVGLFVLPIALSPLVLPPPEAHVRGDPNRIAINARREVYLYDDLVDLPVLRVALNDVRPRPDGQPGMRVCLRIYTYFYLPAGWLYLDMTPEGVHSNNGGVLPLSQSCWQN